MVCVRQVTNSDFSFIRELASEESTFTVPSDYILWMLSKIHPEVCLVAASPDKKPIGYLLGLIDDTKQTLFIWQIAVTHCGGEKDVAVRLLSHVKEVMVARKLTKISFTMQPRLARLWGCRVAKQVFGAFPEQCGEGINGEPEYTIAL